MLLSSAMRLLTEKGILQECCYNKLYQIILSCLDKFQNCEICILMFSKVYHLVLMRKSLLFEPHLFSNLIYIANEKYVILF